MCIRVTKIVILPQSGGAGGGVVSLDARVIIDIDGTIDVSGSSGEPASGGGSGGSLKVTTDQFVGKGQLLCNGGSAINNGGGGSGGRVAIYSTETRFSGKIMSRGGASAIEPGGPGTIFEEFGLGINVKRTLEINNGGLKPINSYMVSKNQYENGGMSWVVVQSQNDLHYHELRLLGGAHVSFVSSVPGIVVVDTFIGDQSGMIHVQQGDQVVLKTSAIEFPSWFRIYEGGYLALPPIVHLNRVPGYKVLLLDGALGYVEEFRIGTEVSILVGDKVCMCIYLIYMCP